MAERVCPGQTQQLHHFVCTSPWACEPLEAVLHETADALVGGDDAVLIIDDTALPKQGRHSVGVKRQHCGVLGKQANCQVLVSLTLACNEVPVPIALRLYLPEDEARRAAAKVPEQVTFASKGDIALEQIDAARADGVRFGIVLADAGFWQLGGISRRAHRTWAAVGCGGVAHAQGLPGRCRARCRVQVGAGASPQAPAAFGAQRAGQGHDRVSRAACPAALRLAPRHQGPSWRHALPPCRCAWPTDRSWRAAGTCPARRRGWCASGAPAASAKYYFTNYPATASRMTLVRAIKARWACEQAHQQLKDELGLDHFEGRSWLGLHHHALLTLMAFAWLQHHRLNSAAQAGKKTSPRRTRAATAAVAAGGAARHHRHPLPGEPRALHPLRRHADSAPA